MIHCYVLIIFGDHKNSEKILQIPTPLLIKHNKFCKMFKIPLDSHAKLKI